MKVAIKCAVCSEVVTIECELADYRAWQNGALIQNVMPYLLDDERELLISGTCGKCFDGLFAEAEE